jgi:hypothetical protein
MRPTDSECPAESVQRSFYLCWSRAHSPIFVHTSFASSVISGPENPRNRAILLGVLSQPNERVLIQIRHTRAQRQGGATDTEALLVLLEGDGAGSLEESAVAQEMSVSCFILSTTRIRRDGVANRGNLPRCGPPL